MTFEETKSLLQDIKNAKQKVRRINREIEGYISIQSSLNFTEGRSKGLVSSPVEKIFERIETERERLVTALEAMFALEDKLAEGMNELDPKEQDVIIGCYMRGRTHAKLARELGRSERQIIRLKNRAISKISKNL